MSAEKVSTVWLPKDSAFLIALQIPIWLIGGLLWGVLMAYLMNGPLVTWLIGGVLWGVWMCLCFALFFLIGLREIVVRLPAEQTDPSQRLLEAFASVRYTIVERAPTAFVCAPRHWIGRRFQCNRLQVRFGEGIVELTGPAFVVNKVRKRLR
jgi:hypothetical protein